MIAIALAIWYNSRKVAIISRISPFQGDARGFKAVPPEAAHGHDIIRR